MLDSAQPTVAVRPAVPGDVPSIRSIFWETAYRTEFDSYTDSESYEYKYLGWYLEYAADLVFVAENTVDDGTSVILGYICGVLLTADHPDLARIAEHIPLFADLYDRFPSHLHINLTAEARGKGIGSKLIERLVETVARGGSPGIHLVTGAGARNVSFYRRNGFTVEVNRQGALFMGRTLQ